VFIVTDGKEKPEMFSGLTTDEVSVLTEVLKEYLTDLRTEILDTDDFKYRQGLKQKEEMLKGILERLEQSRVSAMN
jgi:hypothetical protein